MKIGLDVHGVSDTFPEFFAELTKLFIEAGHEIHIVTGLRQKEVEPELKKLGIRWTHFFSMTDHHESLSTKMTYGPKNNPWMDRETWERTKGDYAAKVGLDIHLDDSRYYGNYFKTPFMLAKREDDVKECPKCGWRGTKPECKERYEEWDHGPLSAGSQYYYNCPKCNEEIFQGSGMRS